MLIKWHGDEYEFAPRTLEGGVDRETKFSNIDAPIFGADTESVHLTDRYEPQCFTLSDPRGEDHLKYLPEKDFAFHSFMRYMVGRFGDYLIEAGNAFIFFHNLEYDWLQLVKNDPRLLEMARIGVGPNADVDLFRIGSFKISLKKDALFSGSAPHFTIHIRQGRTGCNLFFRDSFSFFPSSLAKVAKDLKLDVAKDERQEDLGLRDFRQVADADPAKIYFETYAKKDSRVTQLAGERIRDLHIEARMTKIRASSPGYAIHLLYHMMKPGTVIKSGSWDQAIMQLIFDTYRGGRTGGIVHGRVKNVSVYDFHSSYPASMCSLPSFNENMAYVRLEDLRTENVLAILEETGNAFLRVSGTETDSEYPSLITTHNGKLTPIYGAFENIATTGVEFYVGMKSGGLTDVTVHECVVLLDMDENPVLPFKVFAETAYHRKANSAKGTTEYASAKLALNSAYGKLIESRTQTLISARDYGVYLPYIDGMEKDFGNYYYQKYLDAIEIGLTLEEKLDDLMGEILENFEEEVRSKMLHKMFGDYSISGRIYGRNVVPAAASLITAISRARLLAFIKVTGGLYWDTDSGFVQGEYTDEEMNEILERSDEWLPANVKKLRVGDELGDLDCEIRSASGFLAGIKRYYLSKQDPCPDCTGDPECPRCKGKGTVEIIKSAIHGIPALPKNRTEDVISFLATGQDFDYESKPKPMKANESKTIEEIGSFKSKRYKSAFHLDDRLQWIKTEEGWVGQLKPFTEQGVKEISQAQIERYQKQLTKEAKKIDWIMDQVKIHGFIKTVGPDERYYPEYRRLARGTKNKYFRKNGIPIDVFAQAVNQSTNDLIEQLGGILS